MAKTKACLVLLFAVVSLCLISESASWASAHSRPFWPQDHCYEILLRRFEPTVVRRKITNKNAPNIEMSYLGAIQNPNRLYDIKTNDTRFAVEELNERFGFISPDFNVIVDQAFQLKSRHQGIISVYSAQFTDGPKVGIFVDFPKRLANLIRLPVDLQRRIREGDPVFLGYEIRISPNRVDVFQIRTVGIPSEGHYLLGENASHGLHVSFSLNQKNSFVVELETTGYFFRKELFSQRAHRRTVALLNFTAQLASSIFPNRELLFRTFDSEYSFSDKNRRWERAQL